MATNQDEYKRLFDYHRKTGDDYAVRSHETAGDLSDGYSALSEAHQRFAVICGKLAGVDLSQYEGEM